MPNGSEIEFDQTHRTEWSPHEDRELRTMAVAGVALSDIANRLGRSRDAVKDRFGKLGL